jgi:hypothetical protein
VAYSAKFVLRRPARRDGTCQVRLQVMLYRKPLPIGVGVVWPPELFDEEAGRCLASLPKELRGPDYKGALASAQAWAGGAAALAKRADDYNLILGQAQGKANSIFVQCRLSSQVLTAERFLQEFTTEGSKDDFAKYFYNKIVERHRKGRIPDNTRKNHLSTWRALKAFRPEVPFFTLGPDFADDFQAYLVKHVPSLNTRWGRHKDVKTYLALSKKEKIKFEHPYADFKNQSEPGKWLPLPPMSCASWRPTTCSVPRARPTPYSLQVSLQLQVGPAPGRPQEYRQLQTGW